MPLNVSFPFHSTGEFRNAFLKTIRQIIRESVRNMNIPPLTATSTSAGAAGATSSSRLPGGKPAPPLRSEATRLLGGHAGAGARGPGAGQQQHQDATMTLQLRGKRQQPHQVGNKAVWMCKQGNEVTKTMSIAFLRHILA